MGNKQARRKIVSSDTEKTESSVDTDEKISVVVDPIPALVIKIGEYEIVYCVFNRAEETEDFGLDMFQTIRGDYLFEDEGFDLGNEVILRRVFDAVFGELDERIVEVVLLKSFQCDEEFSERAQRVLFEREEVERIYFVDEVFAVMAVSGMTDGVFVDIGYRSTRILHVVEGEIVDELCEVVDYGGKLVTEMVQEKLIDHSVEQSKHEIDELKKLLWVSPNLKEEMSKGVYTTMEFFTDHGSSVGYEQKIDFSEMNKNISPSLPTVAREIVIGEITQIYENLLDAIFKNLINSKRSSIQKKICMIGGGSKITFFNIKSREHISNSFWKDSLSSAPSIPRFPQDNVMIIGAIILMQSFIHYLTEINRETCLN